MEVWGRDVESVFRNATKIRDVGCKDTLVVLSGGMDSATCLGLAKYMNPKKLGCITFDYGQTHDVEVVHALSLGVHFGVDVEMIRLPGLVDHFKTALSKDQSVDIPEGHTDGVPPTYVPFRNTIMLSIAAGFAQSWGFQQIIYGANIIDYSGYPDCRPEYIDEMNLVIRIHLELDEELSIQAPIVFLTKSDVIGLGNKLEVPWEKTWSCYRGGEKACGKCPSCQYRLKGFTDAGLKDPIAYDV